MQLDAKIGDLVGILARSESCIKLRCVRDSLRFFAIWGIFVIS